MLPFFRVFIMLTHFKTLKSPQAQDKIPITQTGAIMLATQVRSRPGKIYTGDKDKCSGDLIPGKRVSTFINCESGTLMKEMSCAG